MTSDHNPVTPCSFASDDERWMRLALIYSARAQGRTAENPPVGCVLVSADGRLLAAGHTGPNGRPHAEQSALNKAGAYPELLQGAHAYVTLEPCAHHGQTPPCADALISAGVKRVTYAVADPDSRVNGRGHAMLADAGIQVSSGLLAEPARDIMAGFLASKTKNRPAITSKIALSKDGFIAAKRGQQTWLTGDVAKRFTHDLRSRHDAVLTGIDTVLADDPQLNCRLAGTPGDSLARLVMDSRLQLPLQSQLVQSARQTDVLVFTRPDCDVAQRAALAKKGVQVISCEPLKGGRLHPDFVIDFCAQSGIRSILLEAGAELNRAFFAARLIDKVVELVAPTRLASGYSGYSPSQIGEPSIAFVQTADYIKSSSGFLGADQLTIWHRTPTQ
ncbi:MAG: bifunctional diaminohydroxyphosphoribosylaminopyrimidine deaminase/5-amino-6-(5-phosphoribosylamino)uracil reductase RibD [Candidatus Puniceispirillaceae bacterium]